MLIKMPELKEDLRQLIMLIKSLVVLKNVNTIINILKVEKMEKRKLPQVRSPKEAMTGPKVNMRQNLEQKQRSNNRDVVA